MIATDTHIRNAHENDSVAIKKYMENHWGGEPLVVRRKQYFPSQMPGLIIEKTIDQNKQLLGFLFYERQAESWEIIVFEIVEKFRGYGSLLLEEFIELSKRNNCKKIVLMTTNDNLDALRFYQRRGFSISGIHVDSVKNSRAIKPSIGLVGDYGIPVRDEIDLELRLN